ncbi:MAG: hypothetical protein ABL884_06500 [Methyloglobulus sp.]
MKNMIVGLGYLMMMGCAATYAPPHSLAASEVATVNKPDETIFSSAQRALVADGYQITAADKNSGIISTAPRDMRLEPDSADCGTTMGLDYLKDNRTTTQTAIGVVIYKGKVEIKANVQGEYKPGSVTDDITLTCVSKGKLEREMLHKILVEANRR